MSVYIRGMEMPKDCLKCQFCLFADGYWKCLVDGSHADFGGTCRTQNCPLVPVPPHGRLIDADAALRDGWTISRTYSASPTEMVYETKAIDCLPTIIPAEEGE